MSFKVHIVTNLLEAILCSVQHPFKSISRLQLKSYTFPIKYKNKCVLYLAAKNCNTHQFNGSFKNWQIKID